MSQQDQTMPSPFTNSISWAIAVIGFIVGLGVNTYYSEASIFKTLAIGHTVGFCIAICLIIAWRSPPTPMRNVVWLICLYTQGYGFFIILLATIFKK